MSRSFCVPSARSLPEPVPEIPMESGLHSASSPINSIRCRALRPTGWVEPLGTFWRRLQSLPWISARRCGPRRHRQPIHERFTVRSASIAPDSVSPGRTSANTAPGPPPTICARSTGNDSSTNPGGPPLPRPTQCRPHDRRRPTDPAGSGQSRPSSPLSAAQGWAAKSITWTPSDRDYENLRIALRTRFMHLGIATT